MDANDINRALDLALSDHEAGRLSDAEARYRQVLDAQPDNADAQHFLGLAAHQQGRADEAIALMQASLAANPRQPTYHNNLGYVYRSIHRFGDAASCFRRAVELVPDFVEALNNLGLSLREEGALGEAIDALRRAIAVSSDRWELHDTLGGLLAARNDYAAAIECYERALGLAPGNPEVLNNLAIAQRQTGRPEDAIRSYEKALEAAPEHIAALGNLVGLLTETCDWERLPSFSARLDHLTAPERLAATALAEAPLKHMRRAEDPVRNRDAACRRARLVVKHVAAARENFAPMAPSDYDTTGGLRIGYLSQDFRDHPVAHLIAGVMERHDRSRFHVTAYGYGRDDGSAIRRRIMQACDSFVDLRDAGHVAAAGLIRNDRIQILIDLNGHTTEARLEIPALRPAPVQAIFLGYPGTVGGDFIDYIVADPTVAPFDHAGYFTEKIVQLPHCFMPCEAPVGLKATPPARRTLGLPEHGVVFAAFNNSYKFEPVMFGVWMRLIAAAPDSVLWLRVPLESARANLLRFAESCGVAADRLVFAERVPDRADFLNRLAAADLMLDTRIYNGHATTLDALSAGVPVIALEGSQFASRVSASALKAAGVAELIAGSLEEYEKLALELAADEGRRLGLRRRLVDARKSAPLFDPDGFSRALDEAYTTMWRQFSAGGAPEPFAVGSSSAST